MVTYELVSLASISEAVLSKIRVPYSSKRLIP